MLIYPINAYFKSINDDKIYVTFNDDVYQVDLKTFSTEKIEKLPENVTELAIEILKTEKMGRERIYTVQIYSDPILYIKVYYEPYTVSSKIIMISIDEKFVY